MLNHAAEAPVEFRFILSTTGTLAPPHALILFPVERRDNVLTRNLEASRNTCERCA